MSVSKRWVRTEDQITLLYTARTQGGLRGWCGRTLDDGEVVYVDQYLIGAARSRRLGNIRHRSIAYGPVGAECASRTCWI